MNRPTEIPPEIFCDLIDLHQAIRWAETLESTLLVNGRSQVGTEESLHHVVRHFSKDMTVYHLWSSEFNLLGSTERWASIHDELLRLPMSALASVSEEPTCGFFVLASGDCNIDNLVLGIAGDPDITLLSTDGTTHGISMPFVAETDLVLPFQITDFMAILINPCDERDMAPSNPEQFPEKGTDLTVCHFVSRKKGQCNCDQFCICSHMTEGAGLCLFAELSIANRTFEHLCSGGRKTILSSRTTTAVRTHHGGPMGEIHFGG